MAFNPIQFGDFSTRLRRAFGLRGDLGFQLAGPAAQPVVVLGDADHEPYSQIPERWSFGTQVFAGGAGTYGAIVVEGLTDSYVVVDRATVTNASQAYLVRAGVPPALAGGFTAHPTVQNPDPAFNAANATVSPISMPVGTNAVGGSTSNSAGYGDLYVDIYGPFVLWDGDYLLVQSGSPNVLWAVSIWGRRYPVQK